jgi:hypothetical protein
MARGCICIYPVVILPPIQGSIYLNDARNGGGSLWGFMSRLEMEGKRHCRAAAARGRSNGVSDIGCNSVATSTYLHLV